MRFFTKAAIVATVWLAALYLLLLGWRGSWVGHWQERIFWLLLCGCAAELWLLLRRLREDISDLLETAQVALQGFSGPLRQVGENLADAAGDIAATTESVKQKAGGSILDLFRSRK